MTTESFSLTLAGLAPALKNHLWQSTLFLIAAAILAFALRRNQACTRYWLWLAASIKFLIPFSLLITLGSHLATPRATPAPQTAVYFAMEQVSQPFTPTDLPVVRTIPTHPNPIHLVSILLAAIWLAGFLTALTIWFVYWRRITTIIRTSTPIHQGRELEILRRLERAAGLRTQIQLLASPSTLGPGIYGIARPILIWPAAISQRLGDAHIESILAHEIWHVRRRDNLTAVLHMLVEAVFWFHPLVWWLGARLEAERERACDEAVLETSSTLATQPHIYAESILKICEFYVESPLPCVSGVTGADLKQRLTDILERHATLKLTLAKKLLLTAAAVIAITIPILSGEARAMQRLSSLIHTAPRRFIPSALIAPAATEQSPEVKADLQEVALSEPFGLYSSARAIPAEPLKFNIVSTAIKPSARGCPTFGVTPDPNGISVACLTVTQMMEYAFALPPNTSNRLILGVPKWADTTNFDVQTKLADETVAALKKLPEDQQEAQRQFILQSVLESHFQLKAHRETRDTPVYTLVVAKSGLKLKEAIPGQPDIYGMAHNGAPVAPGANGITVGHFMGHAVTVSALANALNLSGYSELDRIVVDKTGLNQKYDFDLKWAWAPLKAGQDAVPGPPIFTAVQDQLGLELESTTRPLETIVIDHMELPDTQGPATSIEPPAAATQPLGTLPTFEVATIRPSNAGPGFDSGIATKFGRIDAENVTLQRCIIGAYGIGPNQISGGPDWVRSERFNILAKADQPINDDAVLMQMLQSLLAERFNLVFHRELRTISAYVLEVAKNGPKLEKADPGEFTTNTNSSNTAITIDAHVTDMNAFANQLSRKMDLPVVNRTGLEGKFNLKLHWIPDSIKPGSHGAVDDISIFDAVQQQLGLHLRVEKVPVEVLVIDHIEKPTDN